MKIPVTQYIVISFLLIGLSGCGIHFNKDGYRDFLTPEWQKQYADSGFTRVDTLNQRSIEITAADIKAICQSKKLTMFVVGLNFCPGCYENFDYIKSVYDSLPGKQDIGFLYLSQDYDYPPGYKFRTRQWGYTSHYYIISHKKYGGHHFKKLDRFYKELCPQYLKQSKKQGFCHFLLADRQGRILFFRGRNITTREILAVLKSVE